MNALERIGMNTLPPRTEIKVSTGGTGLAGLGTGAATEDGGAISQQQAGVLSGGPGDMAYAPMLPGTAGANTTRATVSIDARVLDALVRLPPQQPLITTTKPLCPVPPAPRAAGGSGASGASVTSNTSSAALAGPSSPAGTAGTANVSGVSNVAAALAGNSFADLLARALLQSVENSGLFYESHLAQWASGERPLQAFDREPQSRLVPVAADPSTTASNHGAEEPQNIWTQLTSHLSGHFSGHLSGPLSENISGLFSGQAFALLGGSDEGAAGAQATPAALASAPDTTIAHSAIHPDIVSTVRQQLELLQTPVLHWSGEAWPGTKMHWEIERRGEPAAQGHAEGHKETSWRMHLTLNLPRLGPVDVDLQLNGVKLLTRIKALPDSAATLLHDSDHLRERIAGTGLELKSLAVREMSGAAEHAGPGPQTDSAAEAPHHG